MAHYAQHPVIEFLMRPATYGVARVERIDTHASTVFLAGDRAYKLKRAVKYSYLDYSTIESRQRFCELELQLNRRTAPDLYLEVRPITRERSGDLAFSGSGHAIDWVVVMRRFDQDRLLDRMAERNALSVPLMLELADHIAAFHDAAEVVREPGGYGGMVATAAGNARNLRAAAPRLLDAAAVKQVVEATEHALATHRALLDRRRDEGHVRHCHGDMHLGNICLIDGKPTLFDCIEFDPLIACIDVLYDLAFLLMDLHHRGLALLANAVFNRYLDRREESEGTTALPVFLSMRASVRAHVSAAAAERQSREQDRPRLIQLAQEYLALAEAMLRPEPPRLVAIGGLSGTGKTTLAHGLAPWLGRPPGARVLRSDIIRKRLFDAAPTERLGEEAYREEVSAHVYERIRTEAERLLQAGHSVIADAVHDSPAKRHAIAEVSRRTGVPFSGLWLEAAPNILERRIDSRRRDASDATADVLRGQLQRDVGPVDWQRIDATGSTETVVAAARQALA